MANMNASNSTYNGLNSFLNGKNRKILAHNTIVFREGDTIKVQYHDSVIACLDEQNVTLSNEGYFTPTTKERINWFLSPYNYGIYQESGLWHVYKYGDYGKSIGIFPGNCTYNIVEDSFSGLETSGNERKQAMKSIKAFCKDYMNALLDGKIESPSSGDCWYCFMTFPDSWDHIESHIEESYYVPSLIVKAIQYQDKTSIIAKQTIRMLWDKDTDIPDTFKNVCSEQGYKTLYNYCLHCYDKSKQ
jgi:hypothetical protein